MWVDLARRRRSRTQSPEQHLHLQPLCDRACTADWCLRLNITATAACPGCTGSLRVQPVLSVLAIVCALFVCRGREM